MEDLGGKIKNEKDIFNLIYQYLHECDGETYIIETTLVPKYPTSFPVLVEGASIEVRIALNNIDKKNILGISVSFDREKDKIDAVFYRTVSKNVKHNLFKFEDIPAFEYSLIENLIQVTNGILMRLNEEISKNRFNGDIVSHIAMNEMWGFVREENFHIVPLNRGMANSAISEAIMVKSHIYKGYLLYISEVDVIPFEKSGNRCYEVTHKKSGEIIHLESQSDGKVIFRTHDGRKGVIGNYLKNIYDAILHFVYNGNLREIDALYDIEDSSKTQSALTRERSSNEGKSNEVRIDLLMEELWDRRISGLCKQKNLQCGFLSHPEGFHSHFNKDGETKRSLHVDVDKSTEEGFVDVEFSFNVHSSDFDDWKAYFYIGKFLAPIDETCLLNVYENVVEIFSDLFKYSNSNLIKAVSLGDELNSFAFDCSYIDIWSIPLGKYIHRKEGSKIFWKRDLTPYKAT